MATVGQLFGDNAPAYHQYRPPQPEPAVSWLTVGRSGEALDLGAGTGEFARQLLALHQFSRVHAIEPDSRMLIQLHRHCPDAVIALGTAEDIPVATGSVDAVYAAGAWHWFDTAAAAVEIARVLARNGSLGVVWNMRDRSLRWITELDDIIRRRHVSGHEPGTFTLPAGAPFTPPERFVFSWQWAVSPDEFILSLGTYSHVLALTPPERANVLRAAREFLTRCPDVARDTEGVLQVPIRTVCYRTRVLP